jgi:hypothetical protein
MANLAEFPGVYEDSSQAASVFYPLVLSSFSLSLAENALVTGLIIFKILTEYRGIQGLTSGVGHATGLGRDIAPIIPIMIESGMITFMAQLVLTLIYKFDHPAYPIICGFVVQLYVRGFTVNCVVFDYIYPILQGISTAIVIVRVEMGPTRAYDVDNADIRFAASSDYGNPLPRGSGKYKLNACLLSTDVLIL